jgi:hypothetical protein
MVRSGGTIADRVILGFDPIGAKISGKTWHHRRFLFMAAHSGEFGR